MGGGGRERERKSRCKREIELGEREGMERKTNKAAFLCRVPLFITTFTNTQIVLNSDNTPFLNGPVIIL